MLRSRRNGLCLAAARCAEQRHGLAVHQGGILGNGPTIPDAHGHIDGFARGDHQIGDRCAAVQREISGILARRPETDVDVQAPVAGFEPAWSKTSGFRIRRNAELCDTGKVCKAADRTMLFARFEPRKRTPQVPRRLRPHVDSEDFLDPDELAPAPTPEIDPDALQYKEACQGCGVHLSWIDPCTICIHECTWCLECTEAHGGVCPNCSGELKRRPKRTQPVKPIK